MAALLSTTSTAPAAKPVALVIDDSNTIRRAFALYASKSGFATLEADGAKAGLKMARAHKPDVIFLDATMPDMDGFAVLKKLQGEPSLRRIPVVMMPQSKSLPTQEQCQALGAAGSMEKPFTRLCVQAALDEAQSGRWLSRVERLELDDSTPMAAEGHGAPRL